MSKITDQDLFKKTGTQQLGMTLAMVLLASLLTACGGGSSSSADTGDDTPTATDTDNDGTPDSTDTDDDNDGVADADDAFPLDATESVDTDGDGTGNNADTDDDGDGVADSTDAFPLDATESVDTDGDGTGNNADTDDDGDGVVDSNDNCPLVANANQTDTDTDGIGDACDSTPGTNTGLVVNGFTLLKADGTGAASAAEAACVQKDGLTWVMPMDVQTDGSAPAIFRHENAGVSDYVTNFTATCGISNGWRLPTAAEMKGIVLSVDGSSPLLAAQDADTGFVFDSTVFTDTKAAGTYTVPGYIPFCTSDVTKAVSLSFQGSTVDAQVLDLTDPSVIDPTWTAGNYPCYIRMVNGTATQ